MVAATPSAKSAPIPPTRVIRTATSVPVATLTAPIALVPERTVGASVTIMPEAIGTGGQITEGGST